MDKNKIKNPLIFFFIIPIKIYQNFISPFIPVSCRFYPSCSQYCVDSLRKFGVLRGSYYCIKRLLICHPFGRSGYDPVNELILLKKIGLEKIQKFRKKNLYSALPNYLSFYKEDSYKNTIHYGLYVDESLVSGLTLIVEKKKKICQIRGMFTVSEETRKGYGSLLLRLLSRELIKKNVKVVWCNSRINVVGFYRKNLFHSEGKVFNIIKIGKHQKMMRYLNEKKTN